MPVEIGATIHSMTQGDFEKIDCEVTGLCYSIHNELGRLFDEKNYQNELLHRSRLAGLLPAEKEVPIHLEFGTFRKTLFSDLLLCSGAVFELKTVDAFSPAHESQLLNYLFLTGLQHGKIINMAGESVDGKRLYTKLTQEARRRLNVVDDECRPASDRSEWLKKAMIEVLEDWGAFLTAKLYQEAISFLAGGKGAVTRTEVVVDSRTIGSQGIALLDQTTAFEITAVTEHPSAYERHLRRLLRHTRLSALEWINLSHHDIVFRTLRS